MTIPREGKVPRESLEPRRRARVNDRDAEEGDSVYGSEAMSRHQEVLVPVANPVPETTAIVVVEAVEEVINQPPGAALTDVMSLQSVSERRLEPNPQEDPPLYNDQEEERDAPSSIGTYSLHSRAYSNDEALDPEAPRVGSRSARSREWARHQDNSSSTLTSQFPGDGSSAVWTGPGRELGRDSQNSRRIVNHRPYIDLNGSEIRPEEGSFSRYPYTQQMSLRSGLSHDLTGFSEYDGPQDLDDEDPPEYDASKEPKAVRIEACASTRPAEDDQELGYYPRDDETASTEIPQVSNRSGSRSGSQKVPHVHHNSMSTAETEFKEENVPRPALRPVTTQVRPLPSQDRIEPTTTYTGEFAVEQENRVIFTKVIFVLCGVMLLYEFSLNDWKAQDISENPSFGPSADVLEEAGAKRTDWIIERDEWWRLFTPMFLHAGVVHFILNMTGFLQVGAMVERVFGWWRVGSIYLVSGVFGTIASAIFVPSQVMVGASGAIFGVFGALWADLWQNWSVYQDKCWALTILLILTVVNVILGLMPYLDNFAHIGGIIMGFFMGLGLLIQPREDDNARLLEKKCYQKTLQIISAIAVPGLLILGLVLLYEESDPSEWCQWCENISCVEFPLGSSNPWWSCNECSLAGFEAEVYSNGTYVITCPDDTIKVTEACLGSTQDELIDCCVDFCLD